MGMGLNGGSDSDVDDERYEEAKALVIDLARHLLRCYSGVWASDMPVPPACWIFWSLPASSDPETAPNPGKVFIAKDGSVIGGPMLNNESGVHADTPSAERTQ